MLLFFCFLFFFCFVFFFLGGGGGGIICVMMESVILYLILFPLTHLNVNLDVLTGHVCFMSTEIFDPHYNARDGCHHYLTVCLFITVNAIIKVNPFKPNGLFHYYQLDR